MLDRAIRLLKANHYSVYSEVVRTDTYRINEVNFTPSLVLDIGANVGSFVVLVKSYWPDVKVVAIEPDGKNFDILTDHVGLLPGVELKKIALGNGPVYHVDKPNLALGCQTYHSNSFGYPPGELEGHPVLKVVPGLKSVRLSDLMPENHEGKYIVKVDCEGGEAAIVDHIASNDVLRNADYWTAEIHFYRNKWERDPGNMDKGPERLLHTHGDLIWYYLKWLYTFHETHHVNLYLYNGVHCWLRKR